MDFIYNKLPLNGSRKTFHGTVPYARAYPGRAYAQAVLVWAEKSANIWTIKNGELQNSLYLKMMKGYENLELYNSWYLRFLDFPSFYIN